MVALWRRVLRRRKLGLFAILQRTIERWDDSVPVRLGEYAGRERDPCGMMVPLFRGKSERE